eukprot:SAG31_NODE_4983_length_2820_cov_1.565968_3_plen_141_part_00
MTGAFANTVAIFNSIRHATSDPTTNLSQLMHLDIQSRHDVDDENCAYDAHGGGVLTYVADGSILHASMISEICVLLPQLASLKLGQVVFGDSMETTWLEGLYEHFTLKRFDGGNLELLWIRECCVTIVQCGLRDYFVANC